MRIDQKSDTYQPKWSVIFWITVILGLSVHGWLVRGYPYSVVPAIFSAISLVCMIALRLLR